VGERLQHTKENRMTWADPRLLLPLLAGIFAALALVVQFRPGGRSKVDAGFRLQPAARAFGLLALIFGLTAAWLRW
jgi:hypothetical protein